MGCLASLLVLIISAGVCAIIGAIVRAVTGIEMMFWITSVVLFIFCIPGFLISLIFDGIGDSIHDAIDYAQDREDLRQMEADFAADERMDRYFDKLDELNEDYDDEPDIYIDNRQVHFHNYGNKSTKSRDKNGHFISSKKKKK